MSATYENVTFSDLNAKRQEVVREKIAELWADGHTTKEIAKRVKLGSRSVATAVGNLTRKYTSTSKRRTSR